MRSISIWKDPYCEGFDTCTADEIKLEPGLTVLIGCNGIGKTTLLKNIYESLTDQDIPVMKFDNLHDGGHNSLSDQLFHENFEMAAAMFSSSEGENIVLNLASLFPEVHEFLRTGKRASTGLEAVFERVEKEITSSERWILLDAVDSGLSVDNVVDLKEVFKLIQNDAKELNLDLYIIATANEYELVRDSKTLNVVSGREVKLADYEEYRHYILETRKEKEKRFEDRDD